MKAYNTSLEYAQRTLEQNYNQRNFSTYFRMCVEREENPHGVKVQSCSILLVFCRNQDGDLQNLF